MIRPWKELASFVGEFGSGAMITVFDLKGSGPREVGARMIVSPSGRISGTIGGGRLEWDAMAKAQRMITQKEKLPAIKNYALGPELEQCCGGAVKLLFEVYDEADSEFLEEAAATEGSETFTVATNPSGEREILNGPHDADAAISQNIDGTIVAHFTSRLTPIWLFGAGHVGSALVNALSALPFDVTWIDQRAAPLNDDRSNANLMISANPVEALNECPDDALVVIMTHSHGMDLELCRAALVQDRFSYVGVIGSRTKAARFRLHLEKSGLSQEQIAKLVSPLGVPEIQGKEPAVVAASITAQLLAVRETQQNSEETPVAGGKQNVKA